MSESEAWQFEELLKRMRNTQTQFYNRLAKTGSTTTDIIIRKLAKRHHFDVRYSTIHRYRKLKTEDRHDLVATLRNASTPWIYVRHIYYLDVAEFGNDAPIYINTVREPIERMNSEYHWQRRSKAEIMNLWGQNGTGQMTFDECIAKYYEKDYRKCFIWNMQNYMVRFFCGQADVCTDPGPDALNLAKKHIETQYGVIGDIDDFRTFFKLLEICVPQFFGGADQLYYESFYATDLHKNAGQYSDVPSVKTVSYLKNALKYEYELYYFIRQRYFAFVRFLHMKGYDV